MKIIIIGPLPPIRGGISDTNLVLGELLNQNHRVISISFKRLFPRFFFKQHFHTEKKIISFTKVELLDALNPFTWNETYDYILREKPDRVLFQWWTTYLFPCYFFLSWRLKGKVTLGAIVHDFFPHWSE